MNMQGVFNKQTSFSFRYQIKKPQFYCSYFRIWRGYANRGGIETMTHTAL